MIKPTGQIEVGWANADICGQRGKGGSGKCQHYWQRVEGGWDPPFKADLICEQAPHIYQKYVQNLCKKACLNELQKEYCVKIKLKALDWQWVALMYGCQKMGDTQIFLFKILCCWVFHSFCNENIYIKKVFLNASFTRNLDKNQYLQIGHWSKTLWATNFTKIIYHVCYCKVEKYWVLFWLTNYFTGNLL